MGVREVIEFICDNCGAIESRPIDLLPRGWTKVIDVRGDDHAVYFCPDCGEVIATALREHAASLQEQPLPEEVTDQTSDKEEADQGQVHDHGIDPSCRERMVDGVLRGDCIPGQDRFGIEEESTHGPGWRGHKDQCQYREEGFECTSLKTHTGPHTDLTREGRGTAETRPNPDSQCEGVVTYCDLPSGHAGFHGVKEEIDFEKAIDHLREQYRSAGWMHLWIEPGSPQIDSEHAVGQRDIDVPLGPESGLGSSSGPSSPILDEPGPEASGKPSCPYHTTVFSCDLMTGHASDHFHADSGRWWRGGYLEEDKPKEKPKTSDEYVAEIRARQKKAGDFTRCRFQTEWRGCDRFAGHEGAHFDPDSKISWTGGQAYE